MKNITLLLLLVGMTGLAQINGNKNIETRNFNVDDLKQIKINLNAEIIIDHSAEAGMQITTDTNLFDFITKQVDEGILELNQKEWISPSEPIRIVIGAPHLNRVVSSAHSTTRIINLEIDELKVNALVGTVILEGHSNILRLGSETGNIEASKLTAKEAYINLWSHGKIIVNVTNFLWADVSNYGQLIYKDKPLKIEVKTNNSGRVYSLDNVHSMQNPSAKYINFKIKNNSSNRHQFYVIGPKPDGSMFSYGFPMMPNSRRPERWTLGTQVFKVNGLGFKKLLITISESDENQIIDLFQ